MNEGGDIVRRLHDRTAILLVVVASVWSGRICVRVAGARICATPNLAATQAAQTARLETAVAATLTAQPRPTATRTATPIAAPQLRAGNFRVCLEACAANGVNARWSMPEAVTKVYVAYDFSGIPAGAQHQRIWRVVGRGEWVRYD